MFESQQTPEVQIHSVEVRADDVVTVSYSEKRSTHEWGVKFSTWQFDASAIPPIELQQLMDSADTILSLIETKSRLEDA